MIVVHTVQNYDIAPFWATISLGLNLERYFCMMLDTTDKRQLIKLLAIALPLLATMLFFPVGYDQAVFRVGGDLVRTGSIPFRDFLDTKPPLIFYIYALSSMLFGSHEWSIRVFDALYHLAAIALFYKVLTKHGMSGNLAFGASLLYLLTYIGAGFWMTAQAEAFAVIPTLVAVDQTLQFIANRTFSIRRGIIIGLLSAFLFLLKYTLMFVPIALLLYLFATNRNSLRERLRFTTSLLAGLLAGVGLYVLYLALSGGLDTWIESFRWLAGYASIEPLVAKHVIRSRYVFLFANRLADTLTLSLLIACGIGIYRSYRTENERCRSLLMLCTIAFGLGLAATLYERKLFHYHFLKVLWAFIPLAALGIQEIGGMVKDAWKSSSGFIKRTLVAIAIAVFLFYSPLLSFIGEPMKWMYFSITSTDTDQIIEDRLYLYPLRKMHLVADSLRPQLRPQDQVFFWGSHVGLYSLINKLPETISLTNTPLVTAWTPPQWKEKLYRQLQAAPPEYIIIEKHDSLTWVTASTKDSREHFFDDDTLRAMLPAYNSVMSSSHFDVFRMKQYAP